MSLLSCWDYSLVGDNLVDLDSNINLEVLFSYRPKFGYKDELGNIRNYEKFFPSFGIFLKPDENSSYVEIEIIAFRGAHGYGMNDDLIFELILVFVLLLLLLLEYGFERILQPCLKQLDPPYVSKSTALPKYSFPYNVPSGSKRVVGKSWLYLSIIPAWQGNINIMNRSVAVK